MEDPEHSQYTCTEQTQIAHVVHILTDSTQFAAVSPFRSKSLSSPPSLEALQEIQEQK